MRVAVLGESRRNGENGKVGRVAVGNFVPVKRRGHAGVGQRANGIGRARGAILRVLVVVEEHAVTLLLPPFRTGKGGRAPFDFARKSECRTANLGEGPAWFDARIDMHPARAAGFGPAAKPGFL